MMSPAMKSLTMPGSGQTTPTKYGKMKRPAIFTQVLKKESDDDIIERFVHNLKQANLANPPEATKAIEVNIFTPDLHPIYTDYDSDLRVLSTAERSMINERLKAFQKDTTPHKDYRGSIDFESGRLRIPPLT